MPSILINTNLSLANKQNSELKKSLDDEFRNDLNLLINKLLVKSSMMDSFSIRYNTEDLNFADDLVQTESKKCVCAKTSKQQQEPSNNEATSMENRDINYLVKEIDELKSVQSNLSNKLDLILNKLNNLKPSSSQQQHVDESNVSGTSSSSNNVETAPSNGQLTGAKKRKFIKLNSNNGNIVNAEEDHFENMATDLPIHNATTPTNNIANHSTSQNAAGYVFNNNNNLFNDNEDRLHNEIEEYEIKNESENSNENSDIYIMKNNSQMNNTNVSNSKVIKSNGVNGSDRNYSSSQAENFKQTRMSVYQQILNDDDINELLKGEHVSKCLRLSEYVNFKAPIYKQDDLYYIDDDLSTVAYSKSKSRRNFAAHLTKLVFTPRERLESNCNGRFGKKQLDPFRLATIKNTIFKYYPCKQSTLILNGDAISSGDNDMDLVWIRDCVPSIDEANRVLKKQLIAWHKKSMNLMQDHAQTNSSTSPSFLSVNNGIANNNGNHLFNDDSYYAMDDFDQIEDS